MNQPYSRAPHAKGVPSVKPEAPNAALLIDFDNVTMGMRSDLSKELKTLLNSDIIKGKVTVQRAYADWRRYPQYIVPLSENSVDLIFAPAYGSSKKNATDIRMAIDGMELVFIRPEIGTFILLTGDSDFSSLVLKLKEYGKYVIGVGIQESSSDILVQNCDEYYSYTSLTGLRKTTDSANKPLDPWVLVGEAVRKMASRSDVMRSDRLKQVMMEIDPSFDEGNFGFSKFSRFLSEAAGRDLVDLRKLENGQYEIRPKGGVKGAKEDGARDRGGAQKRPEPRERSRDRGREEKESHSLNGRDPRRVEAGGEEKPGAGAAPSVEEQTGTDGAAGDADPLKAAYAVLREALESLSDGQDERPVRDSDLKRKILEIRPSFDEGELGFGKFSRFLRQAHDHEVVDLEKREDGTYQVGLRTATAGKGATADESATEEGESGRVRVSSGREPGSRPPTREEGSSPDERSGEEPGAAVSGGKGLGLRRGERRGRRTREEPPPLLEGQVALPPSPGGRGTGAPAGSGVAEEGRPGEKAVDPSAGKLQEKALTGELDPGRLGLPTDESSIIRYLTNSYKGVGKKTAESLVEAFGSDLFSILRDDPERIEPIVSGKRAEQLLSAWDADLKRRSERRPSAGGGQEEEGNRGEGGEGSSRAPAANGEESPGPLALIRRRTRRGGRSRRG